jgi:hypothetical protein
LKFETEINMAYNATQQQLIRQAEQYQRSWATSIERVNQVKSTPATIYYMDKDTAMRFISSPKSVMLQDMMSYYTKASIKKKFGFMPKAIYANEDRNGLPLQFTGMEAEFGCFTLDRVVYGNLIVIVPPRMVYKLAITTNFDNMKMSRRDFTSGEPATLPPLEEWSDSEDSDSDSDDEPEKKEEKKEDEYFIESWAEEANM